MVPPASHKLTGVRGTQDPSRIPSWALYRALTVSGSAFQRFGVQEVDRVAGPTTPLCPKAQRFGLFPLRSPLLRESRLISFRRATEMFQFTHCPPLGYVFPQRSPDITLEGLPHSDSPGSSLACSSPGTFRRSPRPSSAFSAKASTLSSCLLVLTVAALTLDRRASGRRYLVGVLVSSFPLLRFACSRQNRSNYASSIGKVLCVCLSQLCDADVISHTFRSLSRPFSNLRKVEEKGRV